MRQLELQGPPGTALFDEVVVLSVSEAEYLNCCQSEYVSFGALTYKNFGTQAEPKFVGIAPHPVQT